MADGVWVHRMDHVDLAAGTGVCRNCGPVTLHLKSRGAGKPPLPQCKIAWLEHKKQDQAARARVRAARAARRQHR